MSLRNTIIYLIGIPAVGKYTVAREIARLTGAKVVDNQLVNTPVFSVIGYDGTDAFPFPAEAWTHIDVIRAEVLAVIRDLCPPDDSFVFTNVLENDASSRALFATIEELAAQRSAAFYPVWLTCEAEELRERKATPDRKVRLKDIDLSSIPRWLQEVEVLRVDHPNALTLDTTHRTPTGTAEAILQHIDVRST